MQRATLLYVQGPGRLVLVPAAQNGSYAVNSRRESSLWPFGVCHRRAGFGRHVTRTVVLCAQVDTAARGVVAAQAPVWPWCRVKYVLARY